MRNIGHKIAARAPKPRQLADITQCDHRAGSDSGGPGAIQLVIEHELTRQVAAVAQCFVRQRVELERACRFDQAATDLKDAQVLRSIIDDQHAFVRVDKYGRLGRDLEDRVAHQMRRIALAGTGLSGDAHLVRVLGQRVEAQVRPDAAGRAKHTTAMQAITSTASTIGVLIVPACAGRSAAVRRSGRTPSR